ncbi:exodeoxyribonuclease III [Patescibacteria group bacterium]|nr:exodeoxyribonuclease III [Patescibacteria group bacterium]
MKIISWNVNGLRAVHKKGFLEWLQKSKADIVCLQEIKAQMDKVPAELLNPAGYLAFYNPAARPGYSGTVVFTKQRPLKVITKIGFEQFDNEGRMLCLDFSDFILINLYLPHGGRSKENLGYKLEVYKYLFKYLKNLDSRWNLPRTAIRGGNDRRVVLVGDFNIAHEEIDLARPKENQNNIMFTPEERLQIEKLVKMGFTDTFRQLHPSDKKYTWWPYFANARARDLGWRIDYAFVSKNLAPKLKRAEILTAVAGSDHCPIKVEI